nr:MAG TPA: hypothetical protein [Caudoviricetes sp.]
MCLLHAQNREIVMKSIYLSKIRVPHSTFI